MGDRIFDGLAQRFLSNVYGTEKGDIRLSVLWEDMLNGIPELEAGQPLAVLDVGGGAGQIACRIAKLGHRVTLAEPSADMRDQAQRFIETQNIMAGAIQLTPDSLQTLATNNAQTFDLVVFHAVLEWLENPFAGLELVIGKVRPGGLLSVMFYNKHSIVFKNIMKGNFIAATKEDFRGQGGSLTPLNPLDPDAVYNALMHHGLDVSSKAGIRCFYDHMRQDARERRTVSQIIDIEKRYCRQPPYLAFARYIHVIARKPGATK